MASLLSKLFFIGLIFSVYLICFETSMQSIASSLLDQNISYTQGSRVILEDLVKYRYFQYIFVLSFLLAFTFLPLKQIDYTDKEDNEEKVIRPSRQSYYDYVKERLEVERMMNTWVTLNH